MGFLSDLSLGAVAGLLVAINTIAATVTLFVGKHWGSFSERSTREAGVYNRLDALIDREQREAEEAKTALRDLQAQMHTLLRDHAKLQAQVDLLTSEVHLTRANLAAAEEAIESKDGEIEQLEAAVVDLESRLITAVSERDKYQALWHGRPEADDEKGTQHGEN